MLRSPAEMAAELATLSDLAREWLRPVGGEPRAVRPRDQLLLLSHQHTSEHLAQVYDPVVCLVVQGEKETLTTTRRHVIAAGEFLVVTHDMPVVSRITKASPDKPYLALILSLDKDILADLQHTARESPAPDDSDPYALRVGDADIDLVDAFVRYLRALEEPNNTAVLLPLVSREIHHRLLNTPPGATLRRLSLGQQPAVAVSNAIRLIRQDLTATLSIRTIASQVGLSPSALHHHFRVVTGTSPLQFQKRLRLLEARRLIQANIRSVTDAAYEVGYSSPTQFSREYRRAFDHPPSHDRLNTTAS